MRDILHTAPDKKAGLFLLKNLAARGKSAVRNPKSLRVPYRRAVLGSAKDALEGVALNGQL